MLDTAPNILVNTGRLGELQVELQLVRRGWHPVRLDTAQLASNADLLAVNKRNRTAIQVKTTDADKQSNDALWLSLGYSTAYLRDRKCIFNSKESPLVADIVIAVCHRSSGVRFVVMPVAFAEALSQRYCDFWFALPTNTERRKRSHTFPIYVCFTAKRKTNSNHHEQMRRNLAAFEERWDVLMEPVEKLHDPREWPLLD